MVINIRLATKNTPVSNASQHFCFHNAILDVNPCWHRVPLTAVTNFKWCLQLWWMLESLWYFVVTRLQISLKVKGIAPCDYVVHPWTEMFQTIPSMQQMLGCHGPTVHPSVRIVSYSKEQTLTVHLDCDLVVWQLCQKWCVFAQAAATALSKMMCFCTGSWLCTLMSVRERERVLWTKHNKCMGSEHSAVTPDNFILHKTCRFSVYNNWNPHLRHIIDQIWKRHGNGN